MSLSLIKKWLGVGLLALALLLSGALTASAQLDYYASRMMTRSLVWETFHNYGFSGMHYADSAGRAAFRLIYPGMMMGFYTLMNPTDYMEYWGDKAWSDGANKSEGTMHSSGNGVLVLTNVDGEKHVSWTGPRHPSEDVFPMIYDILNGPEANWGIRTVVPFRGIKTGLEMSNWYPGATPKSGDATAAEPYEIHNYDYHIYPPVQDAPEEIHITQTRFKHNIVMTRKIYAWSHQDFDDFIIVDVEFENRGDKQLNDTYFGFNNTLYVNSTGTSYRWGHEGGMIRYNRSGGLDDFFRFSGSPGFQPNSLSGLTAADFAGKHITYVYDGNTTNSFEEDTGDPFDSDLENPGGSFPASGDRPKGTPIAPEYAGFAPLAFRNSGSSHVFNANDLAQGYVDPKSDQVLGHWFRAHGLDNIDDPIGKGVGMADLYDIYTAPSMADPPAEGVVWSDQIYGPYDLAPGDKAKIVVAYVFGHAGDIEESNVDSRTGFARDQMSWAFGVGERGLNDDARKQVLAQGEKALLQNLSHAQFAYDSGFRIPNSPPDVDFQAGNNQDANIEISWTDAVEKAINPEYGTADVVAYRIYRSTIQEYGPWELVEEIPATSAGTYKYVDTNSLAGFRYIYNVRAVASPKQDWNEGSVTLADLPPKVREHLTVSGLEGGYSAPETKVNVPLRPKMASSTLSDNLERQVRVVPNPFSVTLDGQSYQGAESLRFVGLPHKCTIRIFSVSGDMVAIIRHDNPLLGETNWELKDRFLSGEVISGLYYFVVESEVQESMGKLSRGAFILHK